MISNEKDHERVVDKVTEPSLSAHNCALNISELLPGDILLYRSMHQKKLQQKISTATGSPYTHASIYLGDGIIAEATPPKIRKYKLSNGLVNDVCIGVLRSQCGFCGCRSNKLREFIDELVCQDSRYDFCGILHFTKKNKAHFENQIKVIKENYGKLTSDEEFANKNYFCSALVVACYAVVGIIAESAQVAYPPQVLSPADLHRDSTFGWLLGYLIPAGQTVPTDDPLLLLTLWKDNLSARWWK